MPIAPNQRCADASTATSMSLAVAIAFGLRLRAACALAATERASPSAACPAVVSAVSKAAIVLDRHEACAARTTHSGGARRQTNGMTRRSVAVHIRAASQDATACLASTICVGLTTNIG